MSMYLHSVFRWYFDGPHKPAQAAREPGHPGDKARGPHPYTPSVTVLDGALARVPLAQHRGAGAAHGPSLLARPELPAKPQAQRGVAPSAVERSDAFDRLPATHRLTVSAELGPLPVPTPPTQPMRPMLSPHQLGLDGPELLVAYDAHFGRQGNDLFAVDGCVLTPQFFLDVQLLDCPEQAQRLTAALWPAGTGSEAFRALAYAPLPALRQRVEVAARDAQLELAGERGRRTAQLLRLHGLEACRIELYTQLLFECQEFSRQFSSVFQPRQLKRAHRLLARRNLSEVAAQFLGGPDAPRTVATARARAKAFRDFQGVLATFCGWLQEAQTFPSDRVPGSFYPACPSYLPAPVQPPPYPG